MNNPESVSLAYTEGSSDKIYNASLEAKGDKFVVNFSYGRRGSTLATGTKTDKPVTYDKAKAIYDKLVREKMAKGYSPGESGAAYQHTDKEQRSTGIYPQLLNEVEEAEMERLLLDDAYWAQEKHDGKRVLLKCNRGEVTGINRSGLTIGTPKAVADAAMPLRIECILDGECVGEVFYAFDLIPTECGIPGVLGDFSQADYAKRLEGLEGLEILDGAIRLVKTAKTTKEKRVLLAQLRADNAEGIVFKRHDAPYVAGRPSTGGTQLKFKFTASATCKVVRRNESKRSVALSLFDGDEWIGVGNVTIPANHNIPKAKDLVEIRYLYAYKGGSLYQPVYLGVRDDISEESCKLSQLKYKPEVADDDE